MNRVLARARPSRAKTGAAKITIQKFYLPDGSSTQLKGVVSDIVLPSVDEFLPDRGVRPSPRPRLGQDPDQLLRRRADRREGPGAPAGGQRGAPGRTSRSSPTCANTSTGSRSARPQKLISLNLDERRKQKAADDAFRKEIKAERDQLAKDDYPYKEFRLGAAPAAEDRGPEGRGPATATRRRTRTMSEDDDDDASADAYGKVDVSLREALRVVDDAIELGRDHEYWASNHAPLTAATKG